jgi:hypothetical protein
LGLPTVLSPRSRSNVDLLVGSLSLIRPAHLGVVDLIHFKIPGSPCSFYNSSLYLLNLKALPNKINIKIK